MTNPIEIERSKDDNGINLCVCIRPYVGHASTVFISKRDNGDGIPRLYFSDVILHRPHAKYDDPRECQFLDGNECYPLNCSDKVMTYQRMKQFDIRVDRVDTIQLWTMVFDDLVGTNGRVKKKLRIENADYSDSELREQLLINLRWLIKE